MPTSLAGLAGDDASKERPAVAVLSKAHSSRLVGCAAHLLRARAQVQEQEVEGVGVVLARALRRGQHLR